MKSGTELSHIRWLLQSRSSVICQLLSKVEITLWKYFSSIERV